MNYDDYYEYDGIIEYDGLDDEMDFDDCPYGSYGQPQLGTEDCEFTCPLVNGCRKIFFARKNCVLRHLQNYEYGPECPFFHMGNCYIDMSNCAPSRLRALWFRFRCRLGRQPTREEAMH